MNHKKWLGVIALVATALILTHLPVSEADAAASASDFQTKGSTLIKYRGTEERVTIPDTVEVVGESAFENNQKVQLVVVPKSVKRMEAYAFWGCDNLQEVVLGKGLNAVDEYSFAGCNGLRQMTIPENILSIGSQAFAGCTNLTDIYIPAEVTSIAEDAFLGCDQVTIHADEGTVAAEFAHKLEESRSQKPLVSAPPTAVPDGAGSSEPVTSPTDAPETPAPTQVPGNVIGSTVVVGNHAMVLVSPEQENVQQGDTALTNISGDQGLLSVTADTEDGKIPEWKYYRDRSIGAVTVPDGTTQIGRFAFSRSSIRTVTIPDGVEIIDYAAFYHCDDLEDINLPGTVTTVGPAAFGYTAYMENFLRSDTEDFLINGDVLLAYKGQQAELTIPEGIRVIADEVFLEHPEIQKVHLPASVIYVGNHAFPDGIEIINE